MVELESNGVGVLQQGEGLCSAALWYHPRAGDETIARESAFYDPFRRS